LAIHVTIKEREKKLGEQRRRIHGKEAEGEKRSKGCLNVGPPLRMFRIGKTLQGPYHFVEKSRGKKGLRGILKTNRRFFSKKIQGASQGLGVQVLGEGSLNQKKPLAPWGNNLREEVKRYP